MSTEAISEQSSQLTASAAPPDQGRTIWREHLSAQGKKYRVGYQIPHDQDLEAAKVLVAGFKDPDYSTPPAKAPQPNTSIGSVAGIAAIASTVNSEPENVTIDVYWGYKDDVTQYTSPEEKDTIYIDKFWLGWNKYGYYNYKLAIKATKSNDYRFFEKGGDSYALMAYWTAFEHVVCFDTKDNHEPVITKVFAQRI
ncbi:hypothetical protein BJ165DRAFT_1469262 [Panaeolus papilionaceus]|nr:hypothetical protein BJ165DRAFT_1469262 [Panaeolus papilionaceus]